MPFLAAAPRIDRESMDSIKGLPIRGSDFLEPTFHDDAPAYPGDAVEVIDLEADGRPVAAALLGAFIRTKHDRLAVEAVIDGEDDGQVEHVHREAPDLVVGEEPQTLIAVKRFDHATTMQRSHASP